MPPAFLNTRRQCPLCQSDVFPIHYNTNEKSNGHKATEETPLIQPSNDHLVASLSTKYEIECPTINSSDAGVSVLTYPINESSSTDDKDNKISTLPRHSTVSHITTTDLVFDQSQSNSQLYSHPQLSHIILYQSSPEEKDHNNTRTATSYQSFHDSSLRSFTTSRAANFLINSS